MTSNSLTPEIYVGDLRFQVLSDSLLRIERCDLSGFEDQLTFHVVSRFFSIPSFNVRFMSGKVRISTSLIEFEIPIYIKHLHEIRFRTTGGWFSISDFRTKPQDLPEPARLPEYWILADYPRLIPPETGATGPSAEFKNDMLSGWQISDNAEDFYVFFPKVAGYKQFKREIVDLTGQIPMLPKHVLGFWYSRYQAFTDNEILQLVDRFHTLRMPVDVFVVDTDWRYGCSTGYEVNTDLFPDLRSFFERMHAKNVRLMFNDHPEPFAEIALSPVELKSREEALGKLLEAGLDSWWYDRNWHTSLDEPAPGLGKDVWGMRLFYEITQKLKPSNRVVILANVPGIKNGERQSPSNIASHRYPVWWTGDTQPKWSSLKNAICNAVDEGIKSLLPFVSDDIGGHFGSPDPELFSRYIQFGSLSPVFRLHCTCGETRDPWDFGEEAERVMGNYLSLRLKLIPMLYSALKDAFATATPVIRRNDLEWPQFRESASNSQYLLGSELLIAPVFTPVKKQEHSPEEFAVREIWIPPGSWHDTWTGRVWKGPDKKFFRCPAWVTPIFARDGAIIVSQPEIANTAMQSWQRLIVDIFIPEERMQRTFEFYEDDGVSNRYLESEIAVTRMNIERASNLVDVKISPPEGGYQHHFSARSWLIRLHFSSGSKMAAVYFNGNMLMPERYRFVTRVERPASLPFICREGYTGKESGASVELAVENYALKNELKLRIKLA